MALSLSLSFLQQNDNKALQITDTAGTYLVTDNEGGWGAPNPAVTDIVISTDTSGGKYHLILDVDYTGSDAVTVSYDQLNLYDLNGTGPFTDAGDLVWTIDPSDLVSSGTAMGTSDDVLLDGKYDFTYKLVDADNHSSEQDTYSHSILLDGNVRVKIYDQLRLIPRIYNSTEDFIPIYHHDFKDILTALLKKGMFDGMLADITFSNEADILSLLDTIERLTIND